MDEHLITYETKKKEVIYYHIIDDSHLKSLVAISCQESIRSLPYAIYVLAVSALLSSLIASGLVTSVVALDRPLVIMEVMHGSLYALFGLLGILLRHLYDENIIQVGETIRNGIFQYDDEDEEETSIRKNMVYLMDFNATILRWICVICVAQVFLLLPFAKWYSYSEEDFIHDNISPFIPYPFCMPFEAQSVTGAIFAFIILTIAFVYFVLVIPFIDGFYITLVLTTVMELRVLNHSLRRISTRAYRLYLIRTGRMTEDIRTEVPAALYSSSEFQTCLVDCLLENLQHHRAILNFIKTSRPYTRGVVFYTVGVVALLYAINVYIIIENPELFTKFLNICIFMGELIYNLRICYFGELVSTESDNLFFALYETPWYHCNRDFKTILKILMASAQNTLKIDSWGVSINASLKTYGDVISAFYKLMNLIRR